MAVNSNAVESSCSASEFGMSHPANLEGLRAVLEKQFGEHIRTKAFVPGKTLTTFGVGGTVPLVVEPRDIVSAAELVHFLHDKAMPWRALGAGSNLLIREAGIAEPVISLGKRFQGFTLLDDPMIDPLEGWKRSQVEPAPPAWQPTGKAFLFVLGGTSLMSLSRITSQWGLSGLEFAAGIPASLGGAVRMNAGAHGSMLSDVLPMIVVASPTGKLRVHQAEELQWSYRRSTLPEGSLVLGAVLALPFGDPATILRRRSSCLDYRKKTQPLQLPSAGSVFRNPTIPTDHVLRQKYTDGELSAGRLVEECGLRGMRIGQMGISEIHGNWIVRLGDGATAEEAEKLMILAETEVRGRFDINLEREIVVW